MIFLILDTALLFLELVPAKESYIMSMMPRRIFLLLTSAALALFTPVPIHAWELHDAVLERVSFPSGTHRVAAETSADFDRDGAPEMLVLTKGRAAIQTGGQIRWQSPQTRQVRQA